MKLAIIGSRNLDIDISEYIPDGVTLVISGGARGIDEKAEAYADSMNIPKLIIKPEYARYGRAAPIKRNELIVDQADRIVALWDNASKGTKHVIDYANKVGKPIEVYIIE